MTFKPRKSLDLVLQRSRVLGTKNVDITKKLKGCPGLLHSTSSINLDHILQTSQGRQDFCTKKVPYEV